MYNLEIAQDHTFTVGEGEWIVHNCAVGPTSGNDDSTDNITMQDILNDPWILEDNHMTPQQVAQIAAREGWVVSIGKLPKSQHDSSGYIFRKPNETGDGSGYTGDYVQWHEGGGFHGPDSYWKVSSGPGGTTRVGPQFQRPSTVQRPSTGENDTGGDFTEGDVPFIDP